MESELRPRDIQTRVRAGASVEELAGQSGMSPAMVERFAAPVLAERAHIAATAMSGTLRRSGESTAHRTLRLVVTERLALAGVDLDAVDWDAYRAPDGRWAVTASYQLDEEERIAEFRFQQTSRFSVTANDEARGLTGEKAWPPAGEDSPDDEPTLNLADEFALAEAVQTDAAEGDGAAQAEAEQDAASPSTPVDPDGDDQTAAVASTDDKSSADDTSAAEDVDQSDHDQAEADEAEADVDADSTADVRDDGDVAAPEFSEDATTSQLDRLFAMFDGPAETEAAATADLTDEAGNDTSEQPNENTGPIYSGLSDAAAVPDVDTGGDLPGTDDAAEPFEPSLFDDDPRFAVPERPERPKRNRKRNQRKRKGRQTTSETSTTAPAGSTGDADVPVQETASSDTAQVSEKSQPEKSQPEKAGPATVKSKKAEPETDAPETSAPETGEPAKVAKLSDARTKKATAPKAAAAEPTETEPAASGASKPAASESAATAADSESDDSKPGATEPEVKAEEPKAEDPKPEDPKAEDPKPGDPKTADPAPDSAEDEAEPKPRKRKGRASVPSWDEIMFGSPRRR